MIVRHDLTIGSVLKPMRRWCVGRLSKRWDERRSQLRQLFVFADTQNDIRFTKWGAFNAIVEYQDHVASSRGNSAAEKAEARALRTIDGSPVKEKAFALLSA